MQKSLEYLSANRVLVTYELPFNEVVLDFYDRLKTLSRGYASLDYHVTGYWESPLVKLDILVNGDPVDALSIIVHRDAAYERGRALAVEDARADSAADVRSGDSGRDRRAHHRARIGEGDAQERAREVLRRRHLAQAQAAREAEGRQEAHEAGRQGRDSAGGVPRRAEDGNGRGVSAEPFKKSVAREYFESLVIAVVLALFIRTFVVQAFKIPTGSMEQNLLIGDHLLVNKFVFGPSLSGVERTLLPMKDIQRLDVIVFKYPEEPERDFIKRVIGLPGEQIELRHKRVYVNGKRLDEPYVYYLEEPAAACRRRSSRRAIGRD